MANEIKKAVERRAKGASEYKGASKSGGSGRKSTNPKQAIAIAMSEASKKK